MTAINPQVKQALRAKYAWPGGYPLYLLADDGEAICIDCGRTEFKAIAHSVISNTQDGWHVSAADINWEDTSLHCAHCNQRIESAYGEDTPT